MIRTVAAATLPALLCLVFMASAARAQETPQEKIDRLERELSELRDFVQASLGEDEEEYQGKLKERIEDVIKVLAPDPTNPRKPLPLFNRLTGGLLFTGYLRMRFEHRANNVDFRSNNRAFDDEGIRMNGRFRLGIGAHIVGGPEDETNRPAILALTEFQTEGEFANNTSTVLPGRLTGSAQATGVPPIFSNPFDEVSLYQGFLHFRDVVATNVDVTVGRREIAYGSEFLFGKNDFYEGITHDSIVVSWRNEAKSISVDGIFAIEGNSDADVLTPLSATFDFDQDQLMGLYFQWNSPDMTNRLMVDAYVIYFEGRGATGDVVDSGTRSTAPFADGVVSSVLLGRFWTLGTRAFYEVFSDEATGEKLKLNLEVAYQTGSGGMASATGPSVLGVGSDGDASIHGWAVEFIANYQFPLTDEMLAIATFGYYFASGGDGFEPKTTADPTGQGLTHIGFQPMFINRHFERVGGSGIGPDFPGGGRYGNMDIIPLANIHIIKAGFAVRPTTTFEVGMNYLFAATADNQGYGTGAYGHELDFFAVFTPEDFRNSVRFSANLSLFIPVEGAKNLMSALFFPTSDTSDPAKVDNDPALAFYIQALVSF